MTAGWIGIFVVTCVGISADGTLRVMSANLTSGFDQSYDPGEGIRIFQGLKPDLVMIQEFNYRMNSAQDIAEFVRTGFGENFFFYRECEPSDYLPNGIISRYPILAAGEWADNTMPNRDFVWARIDIPGSIDLWAISLHLSSKQAGTRQAEAAAVVRYIRAYVPDRDYLVVGGDLNTGSRREQAIGILCQVAGETAPPKDTSGRTNTNINASKPLDWVLVDPDLAPCQVPVVIGSVPGWKFSGDYTAPLAFPTGLVFNSTCFPALDLVAPVQKGDSRAPGMQHLAVIKDFRLRVPGPYDVRHDSSILSLR